MTEAETPIAAASAASAPKPEKPSGPPWFARRYPPHDPRTSMGPVHWKGWTAFAAFSGAMFVGAFAFLFLAVAGSVFLGAIAFAMIAGGALYALLAIVARKGDDTKTMEDYVKDKNAGG